MTSNKNIGINEEEKARILMHGNINDVVVHVYLCV